MKVENYSRQMNILDVEKEKNKPINIIGAGATGSWIALGLAKMGFENINIYDFDTVGEHNLPNQAFNIEDIDTNKAMAVQKNVMNATGNIVKAHNQKLQGGERLAGVVFVLTDSMKSRKDIWMKSLKLNPAIELVIETRMDLRVGRVYAINPNDMAQIKRYEETLYDDAEAEVSACGVSQTVLCTAIGITSQAIWKLLNHINEVPNHQETMIEFENNYILTQEWK
ncbi:ThiF family adenylyltransferase [Romboutsia sp.]|uniref:ThiF family adenylyltransferase n=1 Tax=Romboutsia sp. TaxID=1965302 RepID=UPI002B675C43|nr:ThiF family adenylyltransferase [Romboutsia sp.]HSQ90199.1 ThiF family adenylyltransferase [Romboutsia sp.]